MVELSSDERIRFFAILAGSAERYRLGPRGYLMKVWYHQVASQIGEDAALAVLHELLALVPSDKEVSKLIGVSRGFPSEQEVKQREELLRKLAAFGEQKAAFEDLLKGLMKSIRPIVWEETPQPPLPPSKL